MTCQCHSCRQGSAIEAAKASRDVDELIWLLDEVFDELGNAQVDVDYYRVIMDGSWPSGRRILEHALAKYGERTG